jgi:hypothetical protein
MSHKTSDAVIEQAYQSARKVFDAEGRDLSSRDEEVLRAAIAQAAPGIAEAALRGDMAASEMVIHVPEVPPLGWKVTRLVIEDVWRLFVAPSEYESGLLTPEVRALATLLREVYRALPENPEPRRYLPTDAEAPTRPLHFTVDAVEDGDAA